MTVRRRTLVGLGGAVLLVGAWSEAASAQSPTAADTIRVDLNAVASPAADRCRLTFVIENTGSAIETLRLDLALFGKDGAVQRRIAAELGPLRAAKTNVRAFDVEGGCEQLGAVLVNEVANCAPTSASDCLDRLSLTSRGAVRLFK